MSALDEIRARANAATEGPWERNDYADIDDDGSYELADVTAPDPEEPDTSALGVALGVLRSDAEFIAHARTDVPRLLAALDAALALRPYRRAATDYVDGYNDAMHEVRGAITEALEADQ